MTGFRSKKAKLSGFKTYRAVLSHFWAECFQCTKKDRREAVFSAIVLSDKPVDDPGIPGVGQCGNRKMVGSVKNRYPGIPAGFFQRIDKLKR